MQMVFLGVRKKSDNPVPCVRAVVAAAVTSDGAVIFLLEQESNFLIIHILIFFYLNHDFRYNDKRFYISFRDKGLYNI